MAAAIEDMPWVILSLREGEAILQRLSMRSYDGPDLERALRVLVQQIAYCRGGDRRMDNRVEFKKAAVLRDLP